MVCWGAYGVGTTGAGDFTRVLAFPVVANGRPGTVTVSKALVRRTTLSRGVSDSAWWALALVGTHCVDAQSRWCTWAVLALVDIHTAVVGEDIAWLTVALGHMVHSGTGTTSTVGDTASVHTSVVDKLAHLVSAAVLVGLALHLGAAQRRAGVTNVLLITLTICLVLLYQAVGVGSTVGTVAWVHALSVTTAIPSTRKSVQTISVGATFVGALAAFGVWVAHFTPWAGALVRSCRVGAGGAAVAHLVVTLIDILAAKRGADEANGTHTVASLTDLARSTILFFVATRLTGGVQANFTLKTVLVGMTYLHTDIVQALLSFGTISVDVALPVAHAPFAVMLWGTSAPWAPGGDADTTLLRGWDSGKSRWTGTLDILVYDLAKGIWSTSAFLGAGIDTLKADADFIGRAVAIAPAPN